MVEKILVTGVTGNVGSEVFQQLQKNTNENYSIVASDYKESLVREKFGKEVEFRLLDYMYPYTFQQSLDGIDRIFLMRPPQIANIRKYMAPFIKKAQKVGVKHIVFLSIIGANPLMPHYHVEKFIKKYGIPYTFLRCGFFMQNLSDTHREIIKKEHDLHIPAGKGEVAFIDARDIGEAAAKILTSDKYIDKLPQLTGSERLNYHQVAEKMTKILGFRINYSNPSPKEFGAKLLEYGFSIDFVKVVKIIYWNVRSGHAEDIFPDIKEILGRNPRSLEDYIQDYQNCWK